MAEENKTEQSGMSISSMLELLTPLPKVAKPQTRYTKPGEVAHVTLQKIALQDVPRRGRKPKGYEGAVSTPSRRVTDMASLQHHPKRPDRIIQESAWQGGDD